MEISIPTIDDLSLDEAVGQVLCFGWSGEDALGVNEHARLLVEEMRVGAVVLLGRNVDTAYQVRAAVDELQRLSPVPLLVAIDHEGGRVCRFRRDLHRFPGNMALAAISDPSRRSELARMQARVQGMELRSVRINWNFAPCVDVNSNPENPIIGVRSFGESPQEVAQLGVEVLRGLADGGVLACAKHFPGHGDTVVDSHLGLPTVHGDWSRLSSVELVPFYAAIQAGVPSIMTTHIVFPALDPGRPATVSRAVLHELLRTRMGFDGLVVTDCLEMAAIAETIGTPRAAVEALAAGADMVLVCHTLETQRETVRALRQAVEAGVVPEARLAEAVRRVLRLKQAYAAHTALNEEAWLRPEHAELEATIARASITVVRHAGNTPLQGVRDVCVISAHSAGQELAERLRALGIQANALRLTPQMSALDALDRDARILSADSIVMLTAAPEPAATSLTLAEQAAVVCRLHRLRGNRLTVVAIGAPYDIRLYPEVGTYLCTYGSAPCSLAALADALAGVYAPSGRLPVTVTGR